MIEFDSFDGRLKDFINSITCPNCQPGSPCNRHAGRNVRDINEWLREKKAERNPFYAYDDWKPMTSIQGKFSDN